MYIAYTVIIFVLSVYSYNLVDPNITLVNSSLWTDFRNYMVYWGYYRRDVTSIIYVVLVGLLFVFHYKFYKHHKSYNPIKIALFVGLVLLFAYPFLSHDFFNYMFDAKILTYYHQNPYLQKALDFPADPWIRFMHWTHRTYPYGPVFLLITLVPSFLSFGKFLVAYALFKLLFVSTYLLSVFFLNKLNKRWAVMFATHPLVLMEGLVNSHNDLIGVALALWGIYLLHTQKNLWARVLFILSAGIKYITVPLVFLSKSNKKLQGIVVLGVFGILGYLTWKSEIQPWYFLTLLVFIPYYEKLLSGLWVFFAGLLLSYYPYIRFGGWDSQEKIDNKHVIIIVFLVLQVIYIMSYKFIKKKVV